MGRTWRHQREAVDQRAQRAAARWRELVGASGERERELDGVGLGVGERVGRLVVPGCRVGAGEDARGAADNARGERCDLAVGRRWQRVEGHAALGRLGEHAVGDDDMGVPVGVPERAEALGDGARTGVAAADAGAARAAAMVREHDAHERAEDRGGEPRIPEQPEAQVTRQRQRPLPVARRRRQDMVDEVRGGLGHAPAVARGAQPARLTRPRHQQLEPARRAANAREAALEPAAVEVAPERGLDVAREPEAVRRAGARLGEHGLEVCGDDRVERRGLGPARPVAGRQRRDAAPGVRSKRWWACGRGAIAAHACARDAIACPDGSAALRDPQSGSRTHRP